MSKKSATGALHLTSIELTTAEGQPVKLGIAEARALYAQLHELFGEKGVQVKRERGIPYPMPYPVYPPIIIPRSAPWVNPYQPRWTINTPQCASLSTSDSSGLSVRYSGTMS